MITNIKDIDNMTNINDLIHSFDEFTLKYSFRPNKDEYPNPKVGTILDEDKSVKWNREEVERLRNRYSEKLSELNKEFHNISNTFENKIVSELARIYNFSIEESKKIWSYACDESHSEGVIAVKNTYEEIADLYTDLLSVRKLNK